MTLPKRSLNQQAYRKLISGQSKGPIPILLRCLLGFAAIGYCLVVRLRNLLYSKGWLRGYHVDAAVICVGNVTTGGTGKTPLVVWVYKQIISNFKSQISDLPCAILTRGYKAARDSGPKTQDYSDEIAILAENCPGAKVIVDPDRVAGATEAIREFGAKVLIMDDGFQHRRLARDLDIVAIDATQPFGYGRMLPAGLLREPVTALKRAGAVVMTRCDQIAPAELDELERNVRAIHPDMVVARSIHAPVCARSADQDCISIERLKGKKVFAFCGIGNPRAFLDTIRSLGCKVVGSIVYDDHYHYTDGSLADICDQAEHLGADLVLTTQKDWTKLISDFRLQLSGSKLRVPFAYLAIELRFLAGQDQLSALIEETLSGRIPQNRDASGKVRSLDSLLCELERHRRKNRTIVFTNGCFDVLHRGHLEYLRFCRRQGDVVVVGLNSDRSVRMIKGPDRPVNNQDDRAALLAAMEMIDYVTLFEEASVLGLVTKVRPDVLIKGQDWAQKGVVGREFVESYGGKVILAPLVEGRSSTATIERMKSGSNLP